MAMKPNKKLVVVKSNKVIKELNNIKGPVNTPVVLSIDKIRRMIINEKLSVYECNPKNPANDQTKLTSENYAKAIYSSKLMTNKSIKTSTPSSNATIAVKSIKKGEKRPIAIKVSASDFSTR